MSKYIITDIKTSSDDYNKEVLAKKIYQRKFW